MLGWILNRPESTKKVAVSKYIYFAQNDGEGGKKQFYAVKTILYRKVRDVYDQKVLLISYQLRLI